MIRNWYNQIPNPAFKTKRETTKYTNWRQFTKGSVSGSGPVPDPSTRSLEVRYRTPSQYYEDCLEVREYITMDIYWISLEVRYRTPSQYYEDCLGVREYITMAIYWIIALYFREILFCEYEIFENYLKFKNLCLLCSGYTLNWWRWVSPHVT